MASEVTDLPLPDSPTTPTTSPGLTAYETPSTARVDRAPFREKVTLRFLISSRTSSRLTGARGPRGRPPSAGSSHLPATGHRRDFGSSASRSASPNRVKPSAVTAMHSPGSTARCGSLCSRSWALTSILPHSAIAGSGDPSPR